jgi:hypothetical protein
VNVIMNEHDDETFPAPQIVWPPPESKWDRERRAFHPLLPSLLATHRGKYVAIHDERVVAFGDDQIELALRAYDICGYQAIYVGLVTDVPRRPVRIPSPRSLRNYLVALSSTITPEPCADRSDETNT